MEAMIYALVDATGTVYAEDDASSYADVAAKHGLLADACDQYRFDLIQRQLVESSGSAASRTAVRAYFARHLGSPEQLMARAQEGGLPKDVLATLLPMTDRRAYLDACAAVERQYTAACGANDPCLESGCSMDQDEGCLQPLLRGGVEYQRACAAEWVKWFASPRHRIDAWQY